MKLKFILLNLFLVCHTSYAECLNLSKVQLAKALHSEDLTNFMSIEVADCNAITVDSSSVGFRLDENTQRTHNGVRAEAAINYPYTEGDIVTYRLNIQLPQDFRGDTPKNRWWLITQWHDQPDPRIGETWASFKPVPPPVAIYIEERNGTPGIGLIMYGKDKKKLVSLPTW